MYYIHMWETFRHVWNDSAYRYRTFANISPYMGNVCPYVCEILYMFGICYYKHIPNMFGSEFACQHRVKKL